MLQRLPPTNIPGNITRLLRHCRYITMTRYILDEQTGTAFYYFNNSGEVGFIPRSKTRPDGVEVLNTNEGGVVEYWENKADEIRIKSLLDNK
jgi:hypothetical protein